MYIDAIAAENIEWPTKYDDLFPYADNEDSYWTGYFSSRANDKGYMRRASQTLHSSNKLFSLYAIRPDVWDSTVDSLMQAKNTMLDVVGVIQHHDGITGTGKQHTADDYVKRIYEGLEAVNPVYASAIRDFASTVGFKADEWTWCARTNSTYVDCPIASHAASDEIKMVVAVHNPANLEMKEVQIAVPHGNFAVQRLVDGVMQNAEASVLCNTQKAESSQENIQNCQMYVKHTVQAG